jgi:hypothetical protein
MNEGNYMSISATAPVALTGKFLTFYMRVKQVFSPQRKNLGSGYRAIGCWGKYLGPREARDKCN